jgi:preprotein translocase subunit SecD
VTLTVGILTSIFASVTVVRLLIYYWLNAQPRAKGKSLMLPV